MKLGVLTLTGHFNYGGRLQNYALMKFLEKLGNDPTMLWFDNYMYNKDHLLKVSVKNIIKFFINWKNYRKHSSKSFDSYPLEIIRQYNIKKLSDEHLNIYYNVKLSPTLSTEYDKFIVGSDQIWNPYFIRKEVRLEDACFLEFAQKHQRIAYAASFGISEIPKKFEPVFKKGLEGIPYISVREQAGADIVKKLIGRDVPVLVDPTMLLTKEEWHNLAMQPEWYNGEKYILTYFLGDVPQVLQKLADKFGYAIYNLMDKENTDLYTSRVEEFLWLIEHAQLVCTDSFHACVFSILFNVPFLAVERSQQGGLDMRSRLHTLFNLFGYEDRLVRFDNTNLDFEKLMQMDFSNVENILQRERKRSMEFLKEALNSNKTNL